MDCEILAVFREEQEGSAGLKKARERTKAEFPFLIDLGARQTAAYSQDGFSTYIIHHDGSVLAELTGTKMLRPTAQKILKQMPQE